MKWSRHVALPSLAGVAVIAGFVVYSGLGPFAAEVSRLSAAFIPVILGLALCNYVLRSLRWGLYLRRLEPGLEGGVVVRAFFAGLAMSMSPGKAGEFLKAFWLSSAAPVAAGRVAVAVLMERLMDVLAIAVVSAGAVSLVDWSAPLVAGAGAALGASALLVAAPWSRRILLRLARARGPDRLRTARDSLGALLAPSVGGPAAALSLVAWFAEGTALWVILQQLGVELPLVQAAGIYGLATLAGAASMLPGGLGSTEAALVALLVAVATPLSLAVAATVLVRAATLWFALLIGLLFVPLVVRDVRAGTSARGG